MLTTTTAARAESALVAAATNFADAAVALERDFEKRFPDRVTITFGSTGKLYAQIRAGAPFDVFLSADRRRPQMLLKTEFAIPSSRFTYAVGQLFLWSMVAVPKGKTWPEMLADRSVRSIAIANPDLAPYGLAAKQVLERARLWEAVTGRIVMGENIGQTFGLVATGNAQLGFVARSQLSSERGVALGGQRWAVPAKLHAPIRQDAVLLRRAANNAAAKSFLAYLRGPEARAILKRFGYKTSSD